ncbi:hypothetical protein V1514DRAFT_338375 [Lipomyces japonicus]|uniref:uncharacterized protein n=1 Tax=Lipomyces japonicus TaxID=56871 RepID=UPI0034CF4AB7
MVNSSSRKFVGALDTGTTSTRFIIFDNEGKPYASHQIEFEQIYPYAGWHEQDPLEIIESARVCIDNAVKQFEQDGYSKLDIVSIGITNQRETTVVWDSETGSPLYNAIAWPDTRTARLVHHFKTKIGSDKIESTTGLPLSTYPSALKLVWLLENMTTVADARRKGTLNFGTVDTWLIYNLTGAGKSGTDTKFVTDTTNASRTLFLNINTLQYDPFLLSFFDIDKGINFPQIAHSSHDSAYGKIHGGLLDSVPIGGVLGDQSAALVGQKAFTPGTGKNTYGTGLFLLYNTGESPVFSSNGLLTTVAYHFQNHKPIYALEGSVAVGGSAVKFLRDNLKLISESDQVGKLASMVSDSGGVVFVTAFSGLFAPYWIDDAQGTIFGVTNYTTREHIARATIEATCFQTRAVLEAMQKDSGYELKSLKVDGGMSNSDVCMQIQSDIIGIDVLRPAYRETTALGAAIAAGFAFKVWRDFDDLKSINSDGETTFRPTISQRKREKSYRLWNRAVQQSAGWVNDDDEEQEGIDGVAEEKESEEFIENTVASKFATVL